MEELKEDLETVKNSIISLLNEADTFDKILQVIRMYEPYVGSLDEVLT